MSSAIKNADYLLANLENDCVENTKLHLPNFFSYNPFAGLLSQLFWVLIIINF